MTPALRKRHQRTWCFLGLALLLIWGTSMVAINKNQTAKNQVSTSTEENISMEMKKRHSICYSSSKKGFC